MARTAPPTSFSAGRRWGIFFSVLASIAAVAALTVMLNYLGARHFLRFSWSAKTSQKLSPQTFNLLASITNDVKVIIYYDKQDPLYGYLHDLLQEYTNANSKISARTVDYANPTAAQEVINRYKLGSGEAKNQVIFDCNGQFASISGARLASYSLEAMPADAQTDERGQPKMKFSRNVDFFDGERNVDAMLINVTGPALQAYYLTGHGEPSLDQQKLAYSGFGIALARSHVQTSPLSLAGTNDIPADCNLLVVAGPRHPLSREELEKVKRYLNDGGRLFVLFNCFTVVPDAVVTGLEPILADWGVDVGSNIITDPDNDAGGGILAVWHFNTNHPCASPLVGSRLFMYNPRSITPRIMPTVQSQDPPSVVPLAATGPGAVVNSGGSQSLARGPVPLIVAVEKKNVKGVLQRGTTRIIVAGDSFFLGNGNIETEANGDFAELAARWLLEQTQLMAGVAPRKVVDYKVIMTHAQMSAIRWIFLVAMPGGVLLLGGLVWLRRRH